LSEPSISPQETFADFCVPDNPRIEKVKKWLVKNKYIELNRDIYLLDIGYAKGSLSDNLSEYKNIKKFGIDMHQRSNGDSLTFIRHDCNLGLPDFGTLLFDVVFAGEVIEHIFDDRGFLKQIYAILKPGGILVMTVPNLFFLFNRLTFAFGKMPRFACLPYHYHFYDTKIITQMVSESGFSIAHVSASHILVSTRRNKILGRICEFLGDIFPHWGAHIILFATKP
jgi:2-polyprenyl-3-methyl-5-hydroxy-6-metoxy-1,4-benzoquinol methylase